MSDRLYELIGKHQEEITSLREQVEKLKAELKSIEGALNDPRADLTLTISEIILEMKGQLATVTKERDTEITRNRPLRSLIKSQEEIKSFLLKKSEENKEAVKQLDSERRANAMLTEELAALAEQNEKLWEAIMKRRYMAPAFVDQLLALSFPDLATPALNK